MSVVRIEVLVRWCYVVIRLNTHLWHCQVINSNSRCVEENASGTCWKVLKRACGCCIRSIYEISYENTANTRTQQHSIVIVNKPSIVTRCGSDEPITSIGAISFQGKVLIAPDRVVGFLLVRRKVCSQQPGGVAPHPTAMLCVPS